MNPDQPTALRIRRIAGPVSTDDIIPAKYKHMYTDPRQLAGHVFENTRPGYAATLRDGDAILCDQIFGIGSSREQAVSSLLASGVRAVFAPAFGRILFRNAWNLGLPAIEISGLDAAEHDEVTLDLGRGTITTPTGERAFPAPPARLLEVIAAGGLLSSIRKRLAARRGSP
jgi:3-isopropylmalate/(R)-2-methylmalate dehydratase small subunit